MRKIIMLLQGKDSLHANAKKTSVWAQKKIAQAQDQEAIKYIK